MKSYYQSGDIIGERYSIIRILGEGGTAITYEAVDRENNCHVAIKVLSLQQTQDWKLLELFEREVKALQNLNHPRIPKYLDRFTIDSDTDKHFCLVQELITGHSLAHLVETGWYWQETEVKNIARQILEILSYLHSFNPPVIHRDIKPHNIIRNDDGEIYLVDLGAIQDVYRNTLTRGATFVGTLDYMSPEQIRGQVSFASDLYSLGCTLLYLLTKRSPGELPITRMKIDFRSSLNISEEFANWLDIVLEPIAEDRFKSTTEALDRLNNGNVTGDRYLLPVLGSNVEVIKKPELLIINIPSRWYKIDKVFEMVVINIILIALFRFGTKDDAVSWNFIIIICFFIEIPFLSEIYDSLLARFGYIQIKIDPQYFYLTQSFFLFKNNINGSTTSISRIGLKKKEKPVSKWIKSENHSEQTKIYKEYCTIQEGIKEYHFAYWLTNIERKQIAKEIHKFLLELRKQT